MLLSLIIILVILVFLKPELGWGIRGFINRGLEGDSEGMNRLVAENENLKARLALLDQIEEQIPKSSSGYISAFVFTYYPFSLKDKFLIDVGTNQQIKIGQPVVLPINKKLDSKNGEGILIGRISTVFDSSALVQTVFDKDWNLKVKIGKKGEPSLLKGGSTPKLTVIDKEAKIADGDVVYNADPNFPFFYVLGEVAGPRFSSDQVFKEADLSFAYDLSRITMVYVLK